MANHIDIGAVREQLRVLGHNVPDEVIFDFMKGLNLHEDSTGSEGVL